MITIEFKDYFMDGYETVLDMDNLDHIRTEHGYLYIRTIYGTEYKTLSYTVNSKWETIKITIRDYM